MFNQTNQLRQLMLTRGFLVILIVSAVPLSWFRDDTLIGGGDYFPDINAWLTFERAIYTWWSHGLGGLPKASPSTVYAILVVLLEKIGVSFSVIQKIFFYLLFVGSGTSVFLLAYTINKKDRFTPLLAGLFYITNFWSLVSVWTIPYTFNFYVAFAYSFFPLMLAFFIKGLKEVNGYRCMVYSSLICLLMAPAYLNFVIPFLQLAFLFVVLIYHILLNKSATLTLSKRFLVFVTCWFLINAFWLLPLLPQINDFIRSPYSYASYIDAFRSHSISLLDALRISGTGPNGYWTLHTKVFDDPIIPWSELYSSALYVFFSFLLPAIAFAPLILRPKDEYVLLFSLTAIISIVMIAGSNPPFGAFLEEILIQTQLIGVLRDPFYKVGYFLALSYSFLWASCLATFISRFNSHTS